MAAIEIASKSHEQYAFGQNIYNVVLGYPCLA
jgi:hypothetical protein